MLLNDFDSELDAHIALLEQEVELEQEFKKEMNVEMHHLECELMLPELNFN